MAWGASNGIREASAGAGAEKQRAGAAAPILQDEQSRIRRRQGDLGELLKRTAFV